MCISASLAEITPWPCWPGFFFVFCVDTIWQTNAAAGLMFCLLNWGSPSSLYRF